MSGNYSARLLKLEEASAPAGRIIIVQTHDGETDEQALELSDVVATPADLVVFINHFSAEPSGRPPFFHPMKG
jgi:hypothetical protein